MAIVDLSVVRFEQKPGRCGAATAQMILHYKNLIGSQTTDQDTLWALIQANTGGARPASPPASIQPHDCPQWISQQCDKCRGAPQFTCWCSYPRALQITLTLYNLPLVLSTPGTDQIATASVIDSVDFDVPPAVLVQFGLHWIAVTGYETDGANAQLINGRSISEIYIHDPAVGVANHSIAMKTWMDEYLSPVIQCGIYRNRLVVIAATARVPLPVVTPPNPQTTVPIGDDMEVVPAVGAVRPKKPPKKPRRPPKPPKNWSKRR